MEKRIVIIGGSAAGSKAAAKARRLDDRAAIIIVQKSKDLSTSACGYPYYIEGLFDDRNLLLSTPAGTVRDSAFYLGTKNIEAETETEALSIHRESKTVTVKRLNTGVEESLPYDTLIIATGAEPVKPPISGVDLEGVTTLHSMKDTDYLRRICDEGEVENALVIGGGLVGMEVCEALSVSGLKVTLVEKAPQILPFLDRQSARLVENHVRSKSVSVRLSAEVKEFVGERGVLTRAKLGDGTFLDCALAVIAVGVRPDSKLAREAGLAIGETGGILVDKSMRTSDPNIFAVGDCVEIDHLITGRKVHAPFGDLAGLEGRVAGCNAAGGGGAHFPGTVQSCILKVFDFAAGSSGLSEREARQCGLFDVETLVFAGIDKPHFMNPKPLVTKVTVDKTTRRILGAQCVGQGDVSKQIAQWAIAIQLKATVNDLLSLDLPYAPPFSLAVDHFIAANHCLENKLEGRLKGISAEALKQMLDNKEELFLLDVRTPEEFKSLRLHKGEKLLPLGSLRASAEQLPQDRNAMIVCYCKISLRGYEAALILEGMGYTNVRVLEGGISAWPYVSD